MESDKKNKSILDHVLSLVLRTGLFLAISLVLIGGMLFLWQNGMEKIDYKIFKMEPTSLKSVFTILSSISQDKPVGLIQLGILILIATPIARIISCLIVFALEHDFLYVGFSAFVLSILILSFI